MTDSTFATTSGIALDIDTVAEWVGLHYGRNFEAESSQKKQEWADRFAEAHEFTLFGKGQEILLKTFAEGEFALILECKTQSELDEKLENCGSNILKFLMAELSADQECRSLEEAESRVGCAIEDLEALLGNIQAAGLVSKASA